MNFNPPRFRPGTIITPETAEYLNRMADQIRWLSNLSPEQGSPIRISETSGGRVLGVDVVAAAAAVQSWLAILVDKDYTGSTPEYSWIRVLDDDPPPPLTYTDLPSHGGPFFTGGGPSAFSEQNIDLTVCPVFTTDPASPDSGANNTDEGATAWTDPGNILLSDDVFATAALAQNAESQYLVATDFDFALPAGAVVRAVTVTVEAKASAASAIKDIEVKLVKGGSIVGTSQHAGAFLGTADDVIITYGPAHPSVWGVTLLDTDVEATTFGAAIRYQNIDSSSRTVSVDRIRIEVLYGYGNPAACVVRMRQGAGDYYLCDHEPRIEFVKKNGDPVTIDGIVYIPGLLMRYSQASKALVSVEDILLRDMNT